MQGAKNERCSLLLAETGTVALAMPKKNIWNCGKFQGRRLASAGGGTKRR